MKKKMLIAIILIIIAAATITCFSTLMNDHYPHYVNYDIMLGQYANGVSQKVLDKDVNQAISELKREDGYNRDTIEDWMQRDPKELTTAQMTALGNTYLNMERPEDVEWFINSGYKPVDIVFITPLPQIYHVETDTMKAVTRLVTESVSIQAFATIWSDPGQYGDNDMINQSIERMQLLQVAEVIASYYDYRGAPSLLSFSDRSLGIYEKVKCVSLGSPLMTGPEDAWRDKEISIINDQINGRLSESQTNKALTTANNYYFNLINLGGKICYTAVSRTIVIHGVDLYNSEVENRTIGYARNNNYGIDSPEEVIRIVLEGDENNLIYKDYLDYLSDGRYKYY